MCFIAVFHMLCSNRVFAGWTRIERELDCGVQCLRTGKFPVAGGWTIWSLVSRACGEQEHTPRSVRGSKLYAYISSRTAHQCEYSVPTSEDYLEGKYGDSEIWILESKDVRYLFGRKYDITLLWGFESFVWIQICFDLAKAHVRTSVSTPHNIVALEFVEL